MFAQTSAFKFEPNEVPIGTWHHYTDSNLDGSHKGHFYIYIVDHDHIDETQRHIAEVESRP